MKRKRVTMSYKKMSNDHFRTKASQIQTGLKDPTFLTVTPTPAEVQPFLTQFTELFEAVNLGNRTLIAARDEVRATITEMLMKQGDEVDVIAGGNVRVLELSGFDYTRDPMPSTIPSQGKPITYKLMGPGAVELTAHGIHHADFLEYELDGPGGFCKTHCKKSSKLMLHGLPTGVQIKATVRGVNNLGEGQWSPSVTFVLYSSSQHNDSAI